MIKKARMKSKRVFVGGAGGFIAGHLVGHLLNKGFEVVSADVKKFDDWYQLFDVAENHSVNLEEKESCFDLVKGCDYVFNLACNMGGMGFITNNRALCMLSVLINTHLLMAAREYGVKQYLYSSSACIYPDYRQEEVNSPALREEDAYPAMPEDGYGWEKLFSERMCQHFQEDFEMQMRVLRFHNVYGPFGTWDGGREKAPAALCRKVIAAIDSGNKEVEVWGDGEQTRSFMYIDDCLVGLEKIMESSYSLPLNLGSSELVSINQLLDIIEEIAGVQVKRKYNLDAPQGVRGRNSENSLIRKTLGWEPSISLKEGLKKTYTWIDEQYHRRKKGEKVIN